MSALHGWWRRQRHTAQQRAYACSPPVQWSLGKHKKPSTDSGQNILGITAMKTHTRAEDTYIWPWKKCQKRGEFIVSITTDGAPAMMAYKLQDWKRRPRTPVISLHNPHVCSLLHTFRALWRSCERHQSTSELSQGFISSPASSAQGVFGCSRCTCTPPVKCQMFD